MFSSLSAAKLTYLSAAYMVQSLKSKALTLTLFVIRQVDEMF